jgi:hypothetical protein
VGLPRKDLKITGFEDLKIKVMKEIIFKFSNWPIFKLTSGGLAQLARALDLHSRGQGFDSLILHTSEDKR